VDNTVSLSQNNFGRSPAMKSDTHGPASSRHELKPGQSTPGHDHGPRVQVDELPGAILLARADRDRTVEFASRGSAALLGFEPQHKTFPLAPLIHPEDRDDVLEVIKSAVAASQAFAVEYRLRHVSGHWRTIWEQGRPVRHDHPAVQSQLMDVTHRIQREQARLSTELRLLQLEKFHALNQLAGGVAHEFNNLVAGILGSAELVAMDLPENHPAHETLRQIFEASNQARDFVHKLRAFGLRPTPEYKPVRLQPIIEECLQILRNIIPDKVELRPHLDPHCAQVHGDAAQLQQAILDLCLHSWHSLADRRGRISLTLETCETVRPPAGQTSHLQPGPHVCLTVQDTSHGLEKSARENLFHPFRNRRATGKKVGLELFMVRETIQAHHGEIFVESEPGHGVTFRLYLPAGG
jgi:signal transduction histidine kinase